VTCAISLWAAGCTGTITDADREDALDRRAAGDRRLDGSGAAGSGAGRSGAGPASADGAPDAPGDLPEACVDAAAAQVAEVKMRRLSRAEYDNTLRDLGLASAGAHLAVETFAADSTIGGARRGFAIGGPVDDALAADLIAAATSIAAAATENLPGLVGCAPADAAEEQSCARSFVIAFGRRAYRRPLSDAEVDELLQLFGATRAAYDYRTGVEAVLAAMLSAPEFIYLVDAGPAGAAPGDVVPVDGHALASRLSYFLWDSTPDERLLDAAESGALATDADIEREVWRMLDDPRARDAVRRFIYEWSFIGDLPEARKAGDAYAWYDAQLAADLETSFVGMLERVFWGAEPTLPNWLGSQAMLVNARIAEAYGLPEVAGDELVETELDPTERRGLLTHPAFLALAAKPSRGDPIHRGLFVREQLLCQSLPPPPLQDENGDPIDFNVAPPEPGVSNRERFAQHTKSALCSGCHTLIDPIGFGFENYDAAGRFRTVDENGNPIDASGEVNAGGDLDGAFEGAVALVERVVASETVAECMAVQWFRFALGRKETEQDVCSNAKTLRRFLDSDRNLEELLVALATSDAFRHRKVGAP
jgi:hypothetical protein